MQRDSRNVEKLSVLLVQMCALDKKGDNLFEGHCGFRDGNIMQTWGRAF